MALDNYVSLDSSILYRCNQKYYDKLLSDYEIGYTQLIFLTQIYENEGVSMNELAHSGAFDKGTITKSLQKLESLGYVRIDSNNEDKRSKLLYTTEKAQEIMPKLYLLRKDWINYLTSDLNEEEKEFYLKCTEKLINKAREYEDINEPDDGIRFFGLQKLTLLDYPEHMAATVFTGGCNFRCPFCHNKGLVFLSENETEIDEKDILDYLAKRKGVLDGVCVTGGEALLNPNIGDFISKVKLLGLSVKLDTNGSNFERMKELVEKGLVDYVAMDIKNCPKKYPMTIGIENYDVSEVKRSAAYLLEGHVDYEFRTTVVKGFHEDEDFVEIGEWLKGAKRYFLQNFEDHGSCIVDGLEALEPSDLKRFKEIVSPYVESVDIRGMKE